MSTFSKESKFYKEIVKDDDNTTKENEDLITEEFEDNISEISISNSTINTNKTSKKSALAKYDKTEYPKFCETEEQFKYLNNTQIINNPKLRLQGKTFMLIYEGHLKYDLITKHINNIFSNRKHIIYEDEFIYCTKNCKGNDDIIYKRTYVYINLGNRFSIIKNKFDLEYEDIKLIPSIRMIYKGDIIHTKRFMYFGEPYKEDENKFYIDREKYDFPVSKLNPKAGNNRITKNKYNNENNISDLYQIVKFRMRTIEYKSDNLRPIKCFTIQFGSGNVRQIVTESTFVSKEIILSMVSLRRVDGLYQGNQFTAQNNYVLKLYC